MAIPAPVPRAEEAIPTQAIAAQDLPGCGLVIGPKGRQ